MATDSNVRQSAEGVRTYRGRTLEEILPQIRDELGADAVILREREGLVGGVGGFFAQRFIEVEARAGDGSAIDDGFGGEAPPVESRGGASIDIYDEEDLDPASVMDQIAAEQALLPPGDPLADDELDFSARRQTPDEPRERPEAQPFVAPAVQRERIIPREPAVEPTQPEPAPPSRSFETDVFLERLRAAAQILPENDEELTYQGATAASPPAPAVPPADAPVPPASVPASPADALGEAQLDQDEEEEAPPRRSQRRTAPERKPRTAQPRGAPTRRPRSAPRPKASVEPPSTPSAPAAETTDAWAAAMAALVAEPKPETAAAPHAAAPRPAAPRAPTSPRPAPAPGYDALRQRPPSLRSGLPTGPQAPAAPGARTAGAPAAAPVPIPPVPVPAAPLDLGGRREGMLRGVITRLLGGRFAASTLQKPAPARPLDEAAAAAIASKLAARGASEGWIAQLITTAAAHGVALADSLEAAVEAEIARRIVPAPSLPVTGAAVAFIGAGGSGKTRCTAALASAYRRSSTLPVTVVTIDGRGGERELKRLLQGDGVPVLAVRGEHAQRAVTAARDTGFVIVDTPTATPTDADAVQSLAASLTPLELDGIYVTLPATLGPQAARKALASLGRLNPSAIAITHADETDQLAVVVEIAISHRIPLGYFHSGTDHLNALSSVEAEVLAKQLLEP